MDVKLERICKNCRFAEKVFHIFGFRYRCIFDKVLYHKNDTCHKFLQIKVKELK